MSLASFACLPQKSRGRFYQEENLTPEDYFQIDRARLISSKAFRRLQYKTQVFINYKGDHYRTRLTHSIEVSTIARMVARELKVSEDLAEVIALAHDLGHSAFGHSGEDALNAEMSLYGGFDHNAYMLHLLTGEEHSDQYEGLNLSWEVLEGAVKHNGPITHPCAVISRYDKMHDLDLKRFPSLEAQIAAISDDVAYNCHDLEDGLRSGLLSHEELLEIGLLKDVYDMSPPSFTLMLSELLKRILVDDLLKQTRDNLQEYNIVTIEDIRSADSLMAQHSMDLDTRYKEVKSFLFNRLYRHPKLLEINNEAGKVISGLFELYTENPSFLPREWREQVGKVEGREIYHIASDYIAGMTDRYAIKEYEKYCGKLHLLNRVME